MLKVNSLAGFTGQRPTSIASLNVALASNGSSASASSETQSAGNAIDGSWFPNTSHYWQSSPGDPSTLEIDFGKDRTFDRIVLVHMENDYTNNSVVPDASSTGSFYVAKDYTVDYWDGASWVNIPECTETGNNHVLRDNSFAAVTGSKIRIVITDSFEHRGYMTEVEVWGH